MSLKKILQWLHYQTMKNFPKNNLGDKLFSIINFIRAYKRLPNSKQKLLSNYLFEIKHSTEGYNPLRAYVSDKAFVKDYVRAKVGEDFNVPTIAVLNSFSYWCKLSGINQYQVYKRGNPLVNKEKFKNTLRIIIFNNRSIFWYSFHVFICHRW